MMSFSPSCLGLSFLCSHLPRSLLHGFIKRSCMYATINLAESIISTFRFSVVHSYCGHGIGNLFHMAPSIPHYRRNKAIGVMKPGHVFTIEPMINAGTFFKDRSYSSRILIDPAYR